MCNPKHINHLRGHQGHNNIYLNSLQRVCKKGINIQNKLKGLFHKKQFESTGSQVPCATVTFYCPTSNFFSDVVAIIIRCPKPGRQE